MDNSNWTTRIRKLPRRVLDHPLSGAYAAWVGMAHFAVTASLEDPAKLGTLGLTGAFGVTLAAGRKLFIENDVIRKTKTQLRRETKATLTKTQLLAVKEAFAVLYTLDAIAATKGIVKALPYLTPDAPDVTPWESLNQTKHNPDGRPNVCELVQGAVFYAMQEPGLLTGHLPVKLQNYIVANKPEWLSEYPQHFSRRTIESQRPGLLEVAIQAHGLHHESFERHAAVKAWLEQHAIAAEKEKTAEALPGHRS